MPNRRPIAIGSRFHRLTVIGEAPPSFTPQGDKIYRVNTQCICGTKKIIRDMDLRRGHAKSCGCWNIDAHIVHGWHDTLTYQTWANMLNRCNNSNDKDYHRWGGRGITVCTRWYTFQNFLSDMGPKPPNLTLGRIDNDGPYSPENCRWETIKQQANNRRSSVFVDFKGTEITASEAAHRLGVDKGNLWHAAQRHGSYQAAIDHFLAKGYPK